MSEGPGHVTAQQEEMSAGPQRTNTGSLLHPETGSSSSIEPPVEAEWEGKSGRWRAIASRDWASNYQ